MTPVDADPRAAAGAASQAHRPVARPHRAAAGRARPSRAAAAAGHPCRRHQRQGLDRRLPARDARGRGQARARLHLAASGALQRAHPARRAGGGCSSTTTSSPPRWPNASAPTAARRSPCSRSPPRRRSCCSRAIPADVAAARGRARRPARRHQRDRAAARHASITPISHRPHRFPRRHAREDRRREGRHPEARRAGGRSRRSRRDALAVIERAGRRGSARRCTIAGEDWTAHRGARPAGLSGRRRPARSAGAEARRPPSVRECRHSRSRRCARAGAAAAAGGLRGRHRQGRLAGAHAAADARAARRRSRRRAASSGSTAATIADGGRAIAAALADLEERVSRPLVLIVGMLTTKDCAGFLRNFTGLARRVDRGADADAGQGAAGRGGRRRRARRRHSGDQPRRPRRGARRGRASSTSSRRRAS